MQAVSSLLLLKSNFPGGDDVIINVVSGGTDYLIN